MWTAVVVLLVSLFGYCIWNTLMQGRTTVKPKGMERVLVSDLRNKLYVLGPGDHFLPPWMDVFETVSINREPLEVQGEEVKTSNGVMLLIDYRYDLIAGRPFDESNGHLSVPPNDIDKEENVKDDVIILAVTKIDYQKRHEQVGKRVASVIERQLAALNDEQLMLPQETKPSVPKSFTLTPPDEQWIFSVEDLDPKAKLKRNAYGEMKKVFFGAEEPPIETAAQLYERLAKLIELKINKEELIHVGLNVIGFRINNLRYKDVQMQTSVEMDARMRNLRRAKRTDKDNKEEPLSDTKLLAATEPGQLGQAAIAEGVAKAAESLGDGLKKMFGKESS